MVWRQKEKRGEVDTLWEIYISDVEKREMPQTELYV